jgi:glycosyltransferase involved in cell wall biosynthesis
MSELFTEDPRILFASHPCYLDDSNGAAVASRSLMQCLARRGWRSEVLCGSVLELDRDLRPEFLLAALGLRYDDHPSVLMTDGAGVRWRASPALRLEAHGVHVTIHRGPTSLSHSPGPAESAEFLRLLDERLEALRPQVFVGYGGDGLAAEMFRAARRAGAATVFTLHNFQYTGARPFTDVDEIVVPSHFAAGYYHGTLGLKCTVLPNLVDMGRAVAEAREPQYLTFVNPSREKGVWAFARIADELGRLRPDIPILVVESRGTEETVAECGLDLRARGNVYFMSHTHDPRKFWRRTRVCLMPSLWCENQPLVAVESMANGIPVVGSDRGGIPETLGASTTGLPLPERLTPRSSELPTAEEVAPWVAEVVRLWDDREAYAEASRLASAESSRWDPGRLEERCDRFFRRVGRKAARAVSAPGARSAPTVGWGSTASSWEQIPGFFDFAALYDDAVSRAPERSVFVEVGTLVGRSSCYLATKIRESGKSIALYVIDTCKGSSTDSTGMEIAPSLGGSYAGELHRNILSCGLEGFAVPIIAESVRASMLFGPESVDFCFIDGDHAYESVRADLNAWWPKIRPGGTMAGHDYQQPAPWLAGVTLAVDEFFGADDATSPLAPSCWSVVKPGAAV